MMTIITRVKLKQGAEPEWDAAMRERLENAEQREGWISGHLLMPLEGQDERVIVGVWRTRADWEAWHADEAFAGTRERLDASRRCRARRRGTTSCTRGPGLRSDACHTTRS